MLQIVRELPPNGNHDIEPNSSDIELGADATRKATGVQTAGRMYQIEEGSTFTAQHKMRGFARFTSSNILREEGPNGTPQETSIAFPRSTLPLRKKTARGGNTGLVFSRHTSHTIRHQTKCISYGIEV